MKGKKEKRDKRESYMLEERMFLLFWAKDRARKKSVKNRSEIRDG